MNYARQLLLLCALALGTSAAGVATAQTVLWDFNADPVFSLPANWTNGWNLTNQGCTGGQSCDTQNRPWYVSGGKLRPPTYDYLDPDLPRDGMDSYAESAPFMSTSALISPIGNPVFKVSVEYNPNNLQQNAQFLDALQIHLVKVGTSLLTEVLELTLDDVGPWIAADQADGNQDNVITREVDIEPNVQYRLRVRSTDYDTEVGSFSGVAIDNVAATNGVIVSPFQPTGDFDDDGDVDGADFVNWQRHLGSSGTVALGDANGNGQIAGDDFAIWKGQFGTSGAAGQAVPEPATWTAAAGGIAVWLGRRGARRRPRACSGG